MKKEIIISDEDFKELERLEELGREKDYFISLDYELYVNFLNGLGYSPFKGQPEEFDAKVSELFKRFSEELDAQQKIIDEKVEFVETELKKIPKWVRRLYLGKQDC